ncbi:MAG: MaoC family dehydratase [Paracoccaceae bacterium]|nr:MaoC family dehydratase [Paracoccaceae bacterium]
MSSIALDDFLKLEGQKVGTSRWFEIDQSRIDNFADVTEDHQFIHVDEKAAEKTPFGTTIAHGFLTLSMLSAMIYDGVPDIEGATMGVNYGFDKIRFISPVKSGARVRAHFTLKSVRHPKLTEVTNIWDITVEIEGQERPALIAEWIGRQYF